MPSGSRALGDHLDPLYRAARGMCGSREDAEDLVQQALARVLKRPRFLHSNEDVGYLLRVLRKTLAGRRRSADCRPECHFLLDEPGVVEGLSAARPDTGPDCSELYRAIASLPDGSRDSLIAVDLMGLSYGQAARALRVRVTTITSRLHDGRQRVADLLEANSGVTPAARTASPPHRPDA